MSLTSSPQLSAVWQAQEFRLEKNIRFAIPGHPPRDQAHRQHRVDTT